MLAESYTNLPVCLLPVDFHNCKVMLHFEHINRELLLRMRKNKPIVLKLLWQRYNRVKSDNMLFWYLLALFQLYTVRVKVYEKLRRVSMYHVNTIPLGGKGKVYIC